MQEGSINLKREIKDSIFSSLVKEKKYLREVYLSLYPEDKTIKEEDIKLIKLDVKGKLKMQKKGHLKMLFCYRLLLGNQE